MKERYMHSLVQDKNELRRKRDRAAGMDREILHTQYKRLKNKIKHNRQQHNPHKTIKAIHDEKGKDPRSYWRNLKRLTGLDRKHNTLPDRMRIADTCVSGDDVGMAWIEEFRRLDEKKGSSS